MSFPSTCILNCHYVQKPVTKNKSRNLFFSLDLFIAYEYSWNSKFGANSSQAIMRLVNLAQNFYYWPLLTTRIRLNVVGQNFYRFNILRATVDDMWVIKIIVGGPHCSQFISSIYVPRIMRKHCMAKKCLLFR